MATKPDKTIITADPDVTTAKLFFDNLVDYYNGKTDEFAAAIAAMSASLYPIGCIYQSVVSTSPATLLGFGTWQALGAGQVLVGIDVSDTDFNTVEKTGGSKVSNMQHTHTVGGHVHTTAAHTLSVAEMPAHTHSYVHANTGGHDGNNSMVVDYGLSSDVSGSTGGDQAHTHGDTGSAGAGNTGNMSANNTPSIVQPYIVVYRWKRTA